MALRFPADLEAWQKWQRSRHRLRRLRDLVRRPAPATLQLHVRGTDPAVLFALDATTPTAIASVLEPLAHLGGAPVALLAPSDVSGRLPGEWSVRPLNDIAEVPGELRSMGAVVSAGHFLPAGFAAHAWAQRAGATYFVVQHGLLTPFMAPLASEAHLLAFSERDARFWQSGRSDVAFDVVGSQLLWDAASKRPHDEPALDARPVFLGQLHGAELPRSVSGGTAERFCRSTGAEYRPHPAEVDRLSRLQHASWQRRGIRFAAPGALLDERRPVVSIFSTGVLEAAAAGIPSWVTCDRPPAWVREFWDRYELNQWGGDPTPAPARPVLEPAAAIAGHVLAALDSDSGAGCERTT